MKKEIAIKRINELNQKSFNKNQKMTAIKIINSSKNEMKTSELYNLIIQKIKVGLTFDKSTISPTGSISLIDYDENNSLISKGINHKYIVGENFKALQNILITHNNKIDIIYIDLPYNPKKINEQILDSILEIVVIKDLIKNISPYPNMELFTKNPVFIRASFEYIMKMILYWNIKM